MRDVEDKNNDSYATTNMMCLKCGFDYLNGNFIFFAYPRICIHITKYILICNQVLHINKIYNIGTRVLDNNY